MSVTVSGPTIAFPGEDISAALSVRVCNTGTATAIGNLPAQAMDKSPILCSLPKTMTSR